MDSSRLLLGLIAIADQAQEGVGYESIDQLIPRGVARRLLSALHHRDASIVRHSRRVAVISTGIARSLGWDNEQLMRLEMAALLHDLGKIGIPDQILLKPGKFSPEEADTANVFHRVAVDVLQACGADDALLEIVGQLHTHFNRATDEELLSGVEVHQGARILAVADAYDALTNERPHRPAFSHTESVKHLQEQSGSRFDGNIVMALTRWFEAEGHAQLVTEAPDSTAATERHSLQDEDVREAYFFANMFIYLQLLETTYDAFYVYDSQGVCRVWNRGASTLFNQPGSEVLNCKWSAARLRLCSSADQRILEDADSPIMRVLKSGKPSLTSLKIQRGNDYDDIEVQTLPLLSFSGKVEGVLEIVRDLSSNSNRPGEYRDLKMKVTRDPLTSLANRGHLQEKLKDVSKHAEANNEPYSVIFIDVDHFKKINDDHGHATGDKVLIELSNYLQHETYSGETVGRYGGEEFVLLCPDTNQEDAYRRAERLRSGMTTTKFGGLSITASFGIAENSEGVSYNEVLELADKALYEAKETGRNKTCIAKDGEQTSEDEAELTAEGSSYVHHTKLHSAMAANIITYKLSGFVDDLDARIIKAHENGCSMKIGSGFLGDGEVPIKLDLDFGDEVQMARGTRKASTSKLEINIKITPSGWSRPNKEKFAARCKQVMRQLRGYLLIDD